MTIYIYIISGIFQYIRRGGEFKLLLEIIKCYGHQMYVSDGKKKDVIVILPLNSERACLFHQNLETLIYTGPQDPTFLLFFCSFCFYPVFL